MFKKIIIIGKGSSGTNHINALKSINKNFLIKHVSSRNFNKTFGKNYEKLKKFNPDYFIICSPSSYHYNHIKIIEKFFKNRHILVEKPLFNNSKKLFKKLNNKVFVGYNLRHHPVLKFIKNYIKNKKIFFVRADCSSYLPDWRKKTDYKKSVSARKKLGGGVKLELSHEIDYLNWIFGDFRPLFAFNKKISNLQINCDDILCLNALTKSKTFINLTLNFFSKFKNREILVDGKNFSIHGDLIRNKLNLIEKTKKKQINFKNFNTSKSYMLEHLDLLNKKYKINCTYKEAINRQNTLRKIDIFK